jgi:hypothetical protein
MTTQSSEQAMIFKFSQEERKILKTIGQGNMTEGARVALSWAAHFYNLGLNADMDLSIIGLVTVSSTDKHPNK